MKRLPLILSLLVVCCLGADIADLLTYWASDPAPAAPASVEYDVPDDLVVTFMCFGAYHPLLWGDDVSEFPVNPYCHDPTMQWVVGDLDFNTVVQTEDINWWKNCAAGPALPYPAEMNGTHCQCWMADFDGDGDVDMDDFGEMQILVEGAP